jgi:predicted enzyme related to lactoylglutathione lyase
MADFTKGEETPLIHTRLLALCAALLMGACATVSPDLPAVTEAPASLRQEGRIIWHDLLTTTPAESRKFYGDLFGWEFERPPNSIGFGNDDSYLLIRHKGRLIGGMLDANILDRETNVSQWISVMSVGDIEAAVQRVTAIGGEILTAPTDVGSRGWMAVVAGPDKAIIALLQTRLGDPGKVEPAVNEWLWDELWTNDVAGAASFYTRVAGLEAEAPVLDGVDPAYRVLKFGDTPRAGIMPNPFEGELPVWVNYIRVDDPAAITAKVPALGGTVIVDSQPRSTGGEVALIAGPSGAGVALQTWTVKQEEQQ